MDIKQVVSDTAKSAKFEGASFHFNATEDSRFQVTVELKGSIDLPGSSDQVLANMLGMMGLGKPSSPSED